jgi:uncharacterized RDD family membrane protein YckC
MQTVRIKTSQNIDIDYEVAGLGDRVLARIVDMGVFMGIFYILYYIFLLFFVTVIQDWEHGSGFPKALIVILIIYSIIYIFYDLVAEVFFKGQSVGKYALKIKVVSLDGARPSISQYLMRWVFRLVDFGITFGIGALMTVALSEKKQRIGDIVAGTTLIKTKKGTQIEELYFSLPDDDYEPQFPQVTDLSDSDITLIYEVISNFKRTGNSSLVFNMAIKVSDHLGVTIPQNMNDFDFLRTIARDFSYVASRVGQA